MPVKNQPNLSLGAVVRVNKLTLAEEADKGNCQPSIATALVSIVCLYI